MPYHRRMHAGGGRRERAELVTALLAAATASIATVAVVAVLAGTACSTEAFVPGEAGVLDASEERLDVLDAGGDAPDAPPPVSCPAGLHGPPLVLAEGYCVDATEV